MSKSHLYEQCDTAFNSDGNAKWPITSRDRESFGSISAESGHTLIKEQSLTPSWTASMRRTLTIHRWAHLRRHLGVAALCIAGCSTMFSLAILVWSNGQAVASWKVRPAVYLAIASALANSAIAFAFVQATQFAWWREASKGASIRSLAYQWEASSGLVPALLQIRNAKLVAATAVLVALVVADGPLLQSASKVALATQTQLVTLGVSISPEVPFGFAGTLEPNGNTRDTPSLKKVNQDWGHNTPIFAQVQSACQGTCVGSVKAPGVAKTNCSTTTWPITHQMFYDSNATWGTWHANKTAYDQGRFNPIFTVSLEPNILGIPGAWDIKTSEAAIMTTGFIEMSNNSGQYAETTCALIPAVREYSVAFNPDNEITIQVDPDAENRVVSIANNTKAIPAQDLYGHEVPLTIVLFIFWVKSFVSSNATAWSSPASHGKPWVPDISSFSAETGKYMDWISPNKDIRFADPSSDVVNGMNEIMFRAGVEAASLPDTPSLIDPGLSLHQRIAANQTVTHNVFHSDFRWYAAAMVLELLVVLAVLPLFRGYWMIDGQLNFSPFAMGLAFDAPLLREADARHGVAGVVERLGDMKVRYGEVPDAGRNIDGEPGVRVGFGRTDNVC